MKYTTYQRNHVIFPGSEQDLYDFLDATLVRNGKSEKHKWKHSVSSNSEDALTWSCFDMLRNQPKEKINIALDEIFEDAFGDFKEKNYKVPNKISFENEQNTAIFIGKNYYADSVNEDTEVDASIETNCKLIFFEAKLYSKISLSDSTTPYDQIIRKLRVGLDCANSTNREFYFIFLDIAPINYLLKFGEKAISAENFMKYRNCHNHLECNLEGIPYQSIKEIQTNMGWIPWSSLFKTVLRTLI